MLHPISKRIHAGCRQAVGNERFAWGWLYSKSQIAAALGKWGEPRAGSVGIPATVTASSTNGLVAAGPLEGCRRSRHSATHVVAEEARLTVRNAKIAQKGLFAVAGLTLLAFRARRGRKMAQETAYIYCRSR